MLIHQLGNGPLDPPFGDRVQLKFLLIISGRLDLGPHGKTELQHYDKEDGDHP